MLNRVTPNYRCIRAWLGLLALWLPSAQALELTRADLWQMYQTALTSDATYAAAEAQYLGERAALPLARSSTFYPSLTLQGSATRVRRDDTSTPTEDATQTSSSVNLDWGLFNMTALRTYGKVKSQVKVAEIRYEDAQADLILRLTEGYFGVLSARDNYVVVREQQQLVARQAKLAAERLRVGVGTNTDVFDSQARLQQADADLIAADNQVHIAINTLQRMVGKVPQTLAPLPADAPLPRPNPEQAQVWVDKALRDNHSLQIANLNLEVAASEVKISRASRYPSVDLQVRKVLQNAEASRAPSASPTQPSTNQDTDSLSATASVRWQLFSGGMFWRTKQALYLRDAAQQTLDAQRRLVVAETNSAYLTAVSDLNRSRALTEAVLASESALRAKEESFAAGVGTSLEVLDASRDFAQARTNHLRARYNFVLSLLRLERMVGDLDEKDVQRVNRWLKTP